VLGRLSGILSVLETTTKKKTKASLT